MHCRMAATRSARRRRAGRFHSRVAGCKTFTNHEELEARTKLDKLCMTRGMRAREYCEFQRLLDSAATVAEPEAMFRFMQGVPEHLRNWMKYIQCKTLHEAMALVIRMDGTGDQEQLHPNRWWSPPAAVNWRAAS